MYALLARVYVHPICYPTLYGFIASGGCHNVIHSFFTPLIPVDNIGRDLSPEPLNGPHARARERERVRERERDRPEGNVFERAGALDSLVQVTAMNFIQPLHRHLQRMVRLLLGCCCSEHHPGGAMEPHKRT